MNLIRVEFLDSTEVIIDNIIPDYIFRHIATQFTGDIEAGYDHENMQKALDAGMQVNNLFCIRIKYEPPSRKVLISRMLGLIKIDLPYTVDGRPRVLKLTLTRPESALPMEWFESFDNLTGFTLIPEGPCNEPLFVLDDHPTFREGDRLVFDLPVENVQLHEELEKIADIAR